MLTGKAVGNVKVYELDVAPAVIEAVLLFVELLKVKIPVLAVAEPSRTWPPVVSTPSKVVPAAFCIWKADAVSIAFWNNAVPATSRFAVGAEVPIPTCSTLEDVGVEAAVPAAPVSMKGNVDVVW